MYVYRIKKVHMYIYICTCVLGKHISIIHLINATPGALSLSACRKGQACTNVYHVMLHRSFVNYDELMTFLYVRTLHTVSMCSELCFSGNAVTVNVGIN